MVHGPLHMHWLDSERWSHDAWLGLSLHALTRDKTVSGDHMMLDWSYPYMHWLETVSSDHMMLDWGCSYMHWLESE